MGSRLVFLRLAILAMMSGGTSGDNSTASPMTTNMTTGPTMATNMTTSPPMATNMTTGPTMATNMTTSPPMATNMTTGPTMATNMTTSPPMTTAPPLVFNDTVEPLTANVSRAGCGISQLCASEPADCDPSASGSCFFVSTRQSSGQNFEFTLSGMADGYISAILSPDETLGGNDSSYICANDNGTIKFFSALFNNNDFTITPLNVNSVRGRIQETTIQCTFAATLPDTSTRMTSGFSISVASGAFNGSLGTPNTQLRTNVVNLADPNATIINQLDSTTTAPPTTNPPTTANAITHRHCLSQALLILLGTLALTIL